MGFLVFSFLTLLLAANAGAMEGGITSVFQWHPDGKEAQLNIAAELSTSLEIGKGKIVFKAGMRRGDGISTLDLLSNPCGATSGPNASVESWTDPESVHILEAKAELPISNRLSISFGHLDPTQYFDTNKFANDEVSQFLAYLFVNNISVDWGGDPNFYGPGLVISFQPLDPLKVSIGGFEGDGDYKDILKNPFFIGELDLTLIFLRELNLRIYIWNKRVPRSLSPGTPGVLEKEGNLGFGISADYELTPSVGLFSRIGLQDKDVSEISGAWSFGVMWNGPFGRCDDSAGLGFGLNIPSSYYEEITGEDLKPEGYLEAFWRISISPKLSITPDIQIVLNPAGRNGKAFIPGLRARFEI